jgi:hypothetical protein
MVPIETLAMYLVLKPRVAVFDSAMPKPLAVAYFINFLRFSGVM